MTGVVLSVVQLLLLAFVISSAAALAIASVLRRVDIASELTTLIPRMQPRPRRG